MSKRSRPEEVDFTDEDAMEFKMAMRDPVIRAALYEKTRLKSEERRNKAKKVYSPAVNEHGFTEEEVGFLKEAFPSDKGGRRRTRKRSTKRKRTRKHRKSRKY